MPTASSSIDAADLARFERLGAEWWNPEGPMRPLHQMNPVRIEWMRARMMDHFGPPKDEGSPLAGRAILDVGCGGGLLSESLARMGASVTGIDPAPGSIGIAASHALAGELAIDYRNVTLESVAESQERWDIVCVMEVVEHVVDMPAFIGLAASVLRPGGLLIASTLNRTMKSFALAIVGAEYLLRWVPKGTHQWEKFVAPEELDAAFRSAGLQPWRRTGVVYSPFLDTWRTSRDIDVNYMAAAVRPV